MRYWINSHTLAACLRVLPRSPQTTTSCRHRRCLGLFIYLTSILALLTLGRALGEEPDGKQHPTPTPPPVPPTSQEIAAAYARVDAFIGKPRLIAMNDFGPNDNDNQQYLVRLLLYSNEIDIEGIIPTTSEFQPDSVRPDSGPPRTHGYRLVQQIPL